MNEGDLVYDPVSDNIGIIVNIIISVSPHRPTCTWYEVLGGGKVNTCDPMDLEKLANACKPALAVV